MYKNILENDIIIPNSNLGQSLTRYSRWQHPTLTVMSFQYTWVRVKHHVGELQVESYRDNIKKHIIAFSKLVRCQVCIGNVDCHAMRTRMLKCSSKACENIKKCEWWVKIESCTTNKLSNVYQHGAHCTELSSPQRFPMTLEMKRLAKQMADAPVNQTRTSTYAQRSPAAGITVQKDPSHGDR